MGSSDASSALSMQVQFLKGAGPQRREQLKRLGITEVGHLLTHHPRDYVDRSQLTLIRDLQAGTRANCLCEVASVSIRPTRRGLRNFHAILSDETGSIEAVWFNQPYLKNYVKKGVRLLVSGEVARFGTLQLRSPEYELVFNDDDLLQARGIMPIYPLTAGLNQRLMRSLVRQALEAAEEAVTEFLPPALVQENQLLDHAAATREIHFPPSWARLERARRRLVYDELVVYQILLARRRAMVADLPGISFAATGGLSRKVARSLPFELTRAQKRVLLEIRDDMRRPRPMNRLLMGDVGSGKTLVALLAACLALEEGYQVALLAPTEILAEQHRRSLERFLPGTFAADLPGMEEPATQERLDGEPTGTSAIHLLTGRMKAKERRPVLAALGSGRPGIYVGTHALFQEKVEFANLGLVIVDEQHRFGVKQRAELKAKGGYPDVLVMTATPIPRTLAMAFYGDLDLSVIDELPQGRGEIVTRVVRDTQREQVMDLVRRELEASHRAYIVYPLVSESEKSDLAAATEAAEQIAVHPRLRGYEVGLLHGKMKSEEKRAVMLAFREGGCHVLVTTTVIEVGVDVPEATLMVIEHPERYGLSQLHQLRGRVGRGSARSYFILLAAKDLSADAMSRLRVLEASRSGFKVAEEDLKLRGPGEILGTRQHGLPDLRMADLESDQDLLDAARRDATRIVADDPQLQGPEVKPLREALLTRFGDRARFYHVA
jgi:ATP-dependent DNA helicase RecG